MGPVGDFLDNGVFCTVILVFGLGHRFCKTLRWLEDKKSGQMKKILQAGCNPEIPGGDSLPLFWICCEG